MSKNIYKSLLAFGLPILVLISMFYVYATITEYKPEQETEVSRWEAPETLNTDSTLSLISWNIGYAGLGSNMDFFYDGGDKVRDTKERTLQNLQAIKGVLSDHKNFDLILLQEVDLHSHKTYRINEFNHIAEILTRPSSFAANYKVTFVPVPLFRPLRGIFTCMTTFSKQTPKNSTRYSYPGKLKLPYRLFNLKPCMLVTRFNVDNGKELVIINTHNSAYDDGTIKSKEMDYLRAFALNEYSKGNYVVAGGDWNQSPPYLSLLAFADNYELDAFSMTNISSSFMPNNWKWAYDPATPTNRFLNKPYTKGDNYVGILDFYLLSPNVQLVDCKTIDLNFQNSDHNPVTLKIRLSR